MSVTLRFHVTPVAYAARALATLAARTEIRSLTHHIAGRSTSFAELVAAIRARVPLVDDPAWADRARAGLADPDIAMAYLALGRRDRGCDLFLATGMDFDLAQTRALVGEPEVDLDRIVGAAL